MAVDQGQQWLSDPTGRHRFRLYSDGRATEWVADGNDVSEDPLPDDQLTPPAGASTSFFTPGPAVPTPAPVETGFEAPPARPAGWYRNASNPDEIRYWDGARWETDPPGPGGPQASPSPGSVIPVPVTDHDVTETPGRNGAGPSWSTGPTESPGVAPAASGSDDDGRFELRVRPGPVAAANGAPTAAGRPSGIPADWYPDPSDRTRLRYWDGAGWTEHVLDEAPTPRL